MDTFGEATGVPPDPSLMTYQRCETVLQPDSNSTIRRKKTDNIAQNNIVYKCHPKGHVKDLTLMDCLATPSSTNTTTLLEGEKRTRDSFLSKNTIKTTNMSAKEVSNFASASNKRPRKCWTSLKKITRSNQHTNCQITNLTIQFFFFYKQGVFLLKPYFCKL
uniref:Uncharacterized protein n=1 Tax=Cajanus cajan TaxID=3821 RepID=A0A151TJR8_CAJCA|nr:hypothetical protein KK1_013612 [Cajanus cajan]